MSLLDRIQTDLVSAMKAKQEARLSALRMVKAALQKHAIDTMKPLDDAAGQQILKSLVKQRIDAAEAFRGAGRIEMAEKEEAEKLLIETYLPAAASDADGVFSAEADTGLEFQGDVALFGGVDEVVAGRSHRIADAFFIPA